MLTILFSYFEGRIFGILPRWQKFTHITQDDIDIPWAETNDIAKTMTLEHLLFKNL